MPKKMEGGDPLGFFNIQRKTQKMDRIGAPVDPFGIFNIFVMKHQKH